MDNSKLLIRFDKNYKEGWDVINDGVMGGLSKGHAEQQAEALCFSGSIFTDNNGGFTSTYSKLSQLAEDVESITIIIKGDGNRYQLRIRTVEVGYERTYKVEFSTTVNQTQTHHFNFSDFKATFRGLIINDAPALKANNITHLGFLIIPRQALTFTLSVYQVEFY